MLVLAIFSHLCEGSVGVRPSLELFRHFFAMRQNSGNQTSDCVTFRLAEKKAEANFIPPNLYSHVKEWRKHWMLVKTLRGSAWLQQPTAQAEKHDGWASYPAGDTFEPVLQRIKYFTEKGLDGRMVVLSFAQLRVAPLQARQQPFWLFKGVQDTGRLHLTFVKDEQLEWIMQSLFHSKEGPGLPPSVWMLHPDGASEAILESLPECNRWGIGHPNPLLRRSGSSEPGPKEVLEEEEDDGGSNDDAEGSSSAPTSQITSLPPGRKRGPSRSADPELAERPTWRHRAVVTSADE